MHDICNLILLYTRIRNATYPVTLNDNPSNYVILFAHSAIRCNHFSISFWNDEKTLTAFEFIRSGDPKAFLLQVNQRCRVYNSQLKDKRESVFSNITHRKVRKQTSGIPLHQRLVTGNNWLREKKKKDMIHSHEWTVWLIDEYILSQTWGIIY